MADTRVDRGLEAIIQGEPRQMNTFEAINHIRDQSLSRSEATRYLIEHLGFSATYADEIATVIFNTDDRSEPQTKWTP